MPDRDDLAVRIDKLETLLAYQEQTFEDLSKVVTEQWQEIAGLKRQLAKLTDQLRTVEAHPALAPQDEAPPPHY
ncbi:MAG TPA: SlyX family protein [Devosiaceae bacterium]|jgi:SlyX protein